MAKPNYSFEKRQRERLKKQKKEEKLAQRKAGASKPDGAPDEGQGTDATAPVDTERAGDRPA